MALICTEINEWIEEEISKPIEEWEERTKEKCKKSWYNPFGWKWVCSLVSFLVKVIRWVIVTVGKWVVRTVCRLIGVIITFVVDFFAGLWNVIAGIFTLDWRRTLDGLIKMGIAIIEGLIKFGRIILLVDTVDFIIDEITRWRLRKYVKKLLEEKYEDNLELLQKIKDALSLDFGAFGFRINMSAIRTFVDSESVTEENPEVPNLILLHENGDINLKELAGFEFPQGFSNRKRYKTIKKGLVVGGGGGGEFDNPISEDELDLYISSRGTEGPKFIILCMRDGVLDTKLKATSEIGREIGLMPQWEKSTIEVTQPNHIVHNGFDTTSASSSLVSFLIEVIDRKNKTIDDPGAIKDLCTPVVVGVFKYTDTFRGIAACLLGSDACQSPHNASGVTFIDNKPDIVWKYVPIHELGHFFGLCHVDGLDRIMYSSKQNTWFKLATVPNLLLHGEPKFTFKEAKSTWDYIVEHYSGNCLAGIKEDDIVIVD